jgi:cytochrome P450
VAEYVHSFARRELKDMLNPEPGLIEEIQAIVERHRKDKGTLLKHLLELAESDRITMGDVISIVFGLIGAGVDTLSAVIASEPILDEFGYRDEALVRARHFDTAWFHRAVEERARIRPVFPRVPCWGAANGQLGDHEVVPGTPVVALLPAANRCEEVNGGPQGPDPQTFLVDRNPNEYLSFGLPPSRHFCVGHATAIAVTALASMRLRGQLPSCEFDMEGYHSREQGLVLTVTRAPVRF